MSKVREVLEKKKSGMIEKFTGDRKTKSAICSSAFGVFATFEKQRGAVFVTTAIMLSVLLGFLGLAFDFGNLYIHKTRLQNVVDAAALAGGRAYLESQKNPDENDRDKYDTFPGQGQGREQESYQVGGSKNRSGKHPAADHAADDFIYKNIVNLGTTVKNDEYAHYALKSEGQSPRLFYRIGLYEDVPLYFLSVILGKKEQRVRAGAIALVDDGKGLAPGKTLFDNLFSVEDKISLNSGVSVDSEKDPLLKPRTEDGATIQATFNGDIVLTNKTWNPSNAGDYFYTQEEKEYQWNKDLSIDELNSDYPNMGGKVVSNSSNSIDSNVSGFLNKLTLPHVDLKKNCKVTSLPQPILTSNLNRYKSQDAYIKSHFTITDDEGTVTNYYSKYVTKDNNKDIIKYISCLPRGEAYADEPSPGVAYEFCGNVDGKDIYYYFYTEGYIIKNIVSGRTPECFTYVLDSDGNKIFCNRRNTNSQHIKKYYFDFYRKKLNQDTGNFEYRQIIQENTSPLYDPVETENGITYYYDDAGIKKSFTIPIKKDVNFSKGIQINDPQINNSSVYHLEQDGWDNPEKNALVNKEFVITVDGLAGEEYNPFYLIITGNKGRVIKINVTNSNSRPLIICNLTSNEISEFSIAEGKIFKGIIYSPYSKVFNTLPTAGAGGGSFVGNIVAKELEIQDAGTTWTHQNFVASDTDFNTVSDAVAEKQEERKQTAITEGKNYYKTELARFGLADADWSDPDWFSKLPNSTDEEKNVRKKYQQAWNAARQRLLEDYGLDMPDWPWSEGGKTTDPNQHHYSITNNDNGPTGEKLRLINFRTEYTIEPYINPFNNLYLSND